MSKTIRQTDIAELQGILKPNPKLFADQQTAHDAMMGVVQDCLREAKAGDYFPSEAFFTESMKVAWLRLWSSMAPR